jgi:hypothetical protein
VLALSNSLQIKWTKGDGQKSIVWLTSSLADATPVLTDGTAYTVGATSGNWTCVYNGTDAAATITATQYPALASGTAYKAVVFSYNENTGATSGTLLYNTKANYSNTDTITTNVAIVAPTTAAAIGTIVTTAVNKLTIPVTAGNGSSRVVFVKQSATVPTSPVLSNDVTYTASLNTKDGVGSVVDGWVCVAKGNVASVIPTGLLSNRTYYVAVAEYNGVAGEEKYGTVVTANATTAMRTPTITLAATAKTVTYKSANVAIGATSDVNATPLAYSSDNTSVVAISGNELQIGDAGFATITISQVADGDSVIAATSKTMTVRVKKGAITFKSIIADMGTNATLSAVCASGATATYTVADGTIASVSGSTLTPAKVGQTTITAAGGANDTTVTVGLYVREIASGLAFTLPTGKVYGDDRFKITGVTYTNSTNGIYFTSSNTNVITISNDTIIIVGAGDASVTGFQKGDLYVTDATLTKSITIGKGAATITLRDSTTTFDGSSKVLSVTTTPVGVTTEVTYTNGGSSTTVAPVNAGTYTVNVSINDANYTGSDATATLTINKATQSFTVEGTTTTYSGTAKAVTVTATPSDVSKVVVYKQNGNVVTPVNAGTYDVTITTDSSNYEGSAAATLTINKAKLNVKPSDVTVEYATGWESATKSVTYDGFVNNENESVITGAVSYSTNAKSDSKAGTYKVYVNVSALSADNYSFSADSGALEIQKDLPTGVNDAVAEQISIYPNPVSAGAVTIKGYTKGASLKVTSLSGAVVLEKKLENGSEKVDMSNVPAGTYMFQIVTSNGVEVKQVVKQ